MVEVNQASGEKIALKGEDTQRTAEAVESLVAVLYAAAALASRKEPRLLGLSEAEVIVYS